MLIKKKMIEPHSTRCCTNDGQLLELANIPEHCFPILLPADDPAYATSNARCMNFVRTITDRDRNCVGGFQPAEQVSIFCVSNFLYNCNKRVTSFICIAT